MTMKVTKFSLNEKIIFQKNFIAKKFNFLLKIRLVIHITKINNV